MSLAANAQPGVRLPGGSVAAGGSLSAERSAKGEGCGAAPARATDRDALFREFAPLIRRLVRQYGDDYEARQDLEGELYWRFASFLAAYDGSRGVPLRPYLVHQLTLSAHNHARALRRDRQRLTSLDAQADGFAWMHFSDPTPEWDGAIMTQRMLDLLPAAIARLPERQRRVIIWRYLEQRPFEVIAQVMGVQPATTRSLLRNGLNNLRKWAAADQAEWEPS